jgi:hypothetical protein
MRVRRISSFATSTTAKTPLRTLENVDHFASLVSTRTWVFRDSLDAELAWPTRARRSHPLRDLLMNDFRVLDLAREFALGKFI